MKSASFSKKRQNPNPDILMDIYQDLSVCFVEFGDLKKAAQQMEKYLEASFDKTLEIKAAAHGIVGEFYVNNGMPAKGIQYLEKATALDITASGGPKSIHIDFYNQIAEIYEDNHKQPEKATDF